MRGLYHSTAVVPLVFIDLQLGFLVCFRLSWNTLRDGGARELASALPGMEKLKMLE